MVELSTNFENPLLSTVSKLMGSSVDIRTCRIPSLLKHYVLLSRLFLSNRDISIELENKEIGKLTLFA